VQPIERAQHLHDLAPGRSAFERELVQVDVPVDAHKAEQLAVHDRDGRGLDTELAANSPRPLLEIARGITHPAKIVTRRAVRRVGHR
jgi:hypothetical protein